MLSAIKNAVKKVGTAVKSFVKNAVQAIPRALAWTTAFFVGDVVLQETTGYNIFGVKEAYEKNKLGEKIARNLTLSLGISAIFGTVKDLSEPPKENAGDKAADATLPVEVPGGLPPRVQGSQARVGM